MDQPGGNNESPPQNTDQSSTSTNPPVLSMGSGQHASILQVGGQSFLILSNGQPLSTLQGLGLNLVPVGGPNASLLQTGGPQVQPLGVGGVQPAIGQVGATKPLLNQTERVSPNVVQILGLQPTTILSPSIGPPAITAQVGGLQPSFIQGPPQSATSKVCSPKIRGKSGSKHSLQSVITQTGGAMPPPTQVGRAQPNIVQICGLQSATLLQSQSISPVAKFGGLQHSLIQGPPQSATLKINSSKMRGMSGAKDSLQSVITQTGSMPPSTQFGRGQPKIGQIGGFATSSVQVGSNIPLEMVKTESIPLPVIKHNTYAATEETFPPSGTIPCLSLTRRVQPNVVQFDLPQSSSAQGSCTVPTQTESSKVHAKIKTEPGLEDAEVKPLTIQASGQYEETANWGFVAQTVKPRLLQPSKGHSGGFKSFAPLEKAKKYAMTKKSKQSLTKRGSKGQQEIPMYVDVACSAYNLVKMKHASTNTSKKSKSIGTQVKLYFTNKSQAVQFPEIGNGGAQLKTYQGSSTQSEESWSRQVGFPVSSDSHPYKVVIVRHPEPENSLYLSGIYRQDGDQAWNMEGIHESYEADHPHFDDVAVYFTEDEWACLTNKEKNLYKNVMMDNYWNLITVGKISVTPPVISKIERGEEPCLKSHQQFPDFDYRDEPPCQSLFNQWYNIQHFYQRLKLVTSPICLSMAGLTTARTMFNPSHLEPWQDAQDRITDPVVQCPHNPFLKDKPAINGMPFRCFKCQQTFKCFSTLISHYKAHQSEEYLTCSECGKKFTKMKGGLLHHMTHTREQPFGCLGCGKAFTSQICLNNHLGGNVNKKPSKCGKSFGVRQSLLKYDKLHPTDEHNLCLICGKGFSHKAALQLHQKVHGGPNICSYCGRCFRHEEDCETHMLVHRQMPPIHCAECGNAFIFESQLIEHQKLHQDQCANMEYPDLVIKVEEED